MEKNNLLNNVSSGAGGMAMGLIGSAAGGAISSYYNERAAERAYQRSKDYFDYVAEYNTPEQQKQRLKDAGLSVGLMYGQAGSTGTQQAVSAPQATVDTSDKIGGLGLNAMMVQKQLEVLDSQANKNNAEADKTRGVDTTLTEANISNVIQDTNNKIIIGRLNSLQADYQEIKNYYEADLTEANINEVKSKIEYINSDNQRLLLSNEITGKSKEELIRNNLLNNTMILSNIAKNSAQIKEIKATIEVLKTTKDLNIIKAEGERLLNMINSVEAETTVNSGMTKESGILGSVVNGIRAGVSSMTKLFNNLK